MLAICIESSHARGMGHLYRMRNLANLMRGKAAPFILLLNEHAPAVNLLVEERLPFEVVDLHQVDENPTELLRRHGVKIWLNDRLDTSYAHANAVKTAGAHLATFDDRGDGAKLADIHFASLIFTDEVLGGQRVFKGADYLILNPEINQYRKLRQQVRSLLVSLGGTDTHGATLSVVRHLRRAGLRATVVVGPGFEHHDRLARELGPEFVLKIGVPSLIEEMSLHDLAITGGGVTAFEAAASGLPAIVVANEDFEIPVARYLVGLGAARFAGHHTELDESAFGIPQNIEEMSANGLNKLSLGGVERVFERLYELA